jgi:hypothetical protein
MAMTVPYVSVLKPSYLYQNGPIHTKTDYALSSWFESMSGSH